MSCHQFSERSHAELYNLYRPDIPQEIADKIKTYLTQTFHGSLEQAVDIGCGSGQSTAIWAPHFRTVTGIDVSRAQIDVAKKSKTFPNIIFVVGQAETLPFETGSVQLVTACASIHWFEKEVFFAEIRRILVPGGVFAAYTYHFVKPLTEDSIFAEKIENLFTEKCKELFPFFSKEVSSSLNKYEDVHFPFEEVVRAPDVRQTFDGKLSDVTGYIETLSGFQNMKKSDPQRAQRYISDFSERLKEIFRLNFSEDINLKLYRDFYIVLCRKSV